MGDVRLLGRAGHRGRRRRGPAAVLAVLTLTAVLVGCGDDEPDPTEGGASPSTTDEPTESTEPTEPTDPTDPTESEPPDSGTPLGTGTAPAAGEEITTDAFSVRIPEGWRTSQQDAEGFNAAPREYNLENMQVIVIQNDGRASDPAGALREYAQLYPRPPRDLPEVEVGGVPMFHAAGAVSDATWVEAFGSNSTDHTVWITFQSSPDITSPKERLARADSVLATIESVG